MLSNMAPATRYIASRQPPRFLGKRLGPSQWAVSPDPTFIPMSTGGWSCAGKRLVTCSSASETPARRNMHSSSHQAALYPATSLNNTATYPEAQQRTRDMVPSPPLACLPLKNVLRSLMTNTISSSPLLLPPSLRIMSILANSEDAILNPDRNPILKYFLKHTFYAQFCAGENAQEVRHAISSLKQMGFSGVILGYAKEVVLTDAQRKNLAKCEQGAEAEECVRNEITPWAKGTLETVRLASPGDFVSLKFTGAGRQALLTLSERMAPPKALADSIDQICELARERGIKLLIDAEQQSLQTGIDDWTLAYMRKYNTSNQALVYNTYQAYLKAAPKVLSEHLAVAQRDGFCLGVKLVRGAYLGSDPRHLIHDTKADTDKCFDGIAAALLRRQWALPLTAPADAGRSFPAAAMMVASHNPDSVRKVRAMLESGMPGTEVSFAQLQGMADEVSCELVASKSGDAVERQAKMTVSASAYKYLVWGTTGECMKYLLRRAYENRDAVQRTISGRDAMRAELMRRVKATFGFSS